MRNFATRLQGGHPNSLGQTVEVVEEVLAHPEAFDELFHCYFSEDEVVRLRTSNAMKRIAKAQYDWLIPYLDRFLTEIAAIDQASTQWTLAQLFGMYTQELSPDQLTHAKALLQHKLETHQDWIVLNSSMDTLGKWAREDEALKTWLLPQLARLHEDTRKSVAKRAAKWLTQLG